MSKRVKIEFDDGLCDDVTLHILKFHLLIIPADPVYLEEYVFFGKFQNSRNIVQIFKAISFKIDRTTCFIPYYGLDHIIMYDNMDDRYIDDLLLLDFSKVRFEIDFNVINSFGPLNKLHKLFNSTPMIGYHDNQTFDIVVKPYYQEKLRNVNIKKICNILTGNLSIKKLKIHNNIYLDDLIECNRETRRVTVTASDNIFINKLFTTTLKNLKVLNLCKDTKPITVIQYCQGITFQISSNIRSITNLTKLRLENIIGWSWKLLENKNMINLRVVFLKDVHNDLAHYRKFHPSVISYYRYKDTSSIWIKFPKLKILSIVQCSGVTEDMISKQSYQDLDLLCLDTPGVVSQKYIRIDSNCKYMMRSKIYENFMNKKSKLSTQPLLKELHRTNRLINTECNWNGINVLYKKHFRKYFR